MTISLDTDTRIGVVGLGIMGAGIVEVFARNGFTIVAVAESAPAVAAGQANLAKSLDRALVKGKLTATEVTEISSRVHWSESYADLADCGLVVEAAPENIELKRTIFRQLDELVRGDAILASNTSSLSITQIAQATSRPAQVIGLHFFNPAPIQKFIEIITTSQTAEAVVSQSVALSKLLQKQAAVITDQPGFIVNRLLLVYLNHAAKLLDSGKYDLGTIDGAMRELAGFPMGPLELADLIGLDTCLAILQTIASATGDAHHEPANSLVAHVSAGEFGRKSAVGYYSYANRHEAITSNDEEAKAEVFEILHSAYVQDAAQMANSGYASVADINNGMMLGCGLPQGPLAN